MLDINTIDSYLKFDNGKLLSCLDNYTPSAAASFVHMQYRNMILSPDFACPGAKTTFSQGTYRFGLFEKMGDPNSAKLLGDSLRRFIEERKTWNTNFTAFIACFKEPIPMSHLEFAQNLWSTLQVLHGEDIEQWDPHTNSDPESPEFAFSFGGMSFFIAGMHSGSPRFTRRFAWPTLNFNAHEQFRYLRKKGIFEKFRDLVRSRDTKLQGHVNPASTEFGNISEAIQYTGEIKDTSWKCPFHAFIKAKKGK